MKKYIITILDLRSGINDKIVIYDNDINNVCDLHLGGFHNLIIHGRDEKNTVISGFLRDSAKSFSILCYTPNN